MCTLSSTIFLQSKTHGLFSPSPLQHFTGQREEFEGTRESLLVWLTEMDLQLTNVEHFSETDTQHKMKQLNVRGEWVGLGEGGADRDYTHTHKLRNAYSLVDTHTHGGMCIHTVTVLHM